MRNATAVIVVVGDEILAGHTQDTNSHWLAQRLRGLGVRLLRIEAIPDQVAEIAATLGRSLVREEPSFLFVIGGIGPTPDDRTCAGVARALGGELVARKRDLDALRRLARERGYGNEAWADPTRSQGMRRMVSVPTGSKPLANPVGAALGCVAAMGTTRVVVFPGVPREFYAMFDRSFAPVYARNARSREVTHEVEVWGAEASLWERLSRLEEQFPALRIGSYPQDDLGRIILRITGGKKSADRALRSLQDLVAVMTKKNLRIRRRKVGKKTR